jgi:hypothetical protein
MAEDALVHNAIPARKLLDDIQRYDGFDRGPDENGILPADHTGLYVGWRRMLTWYTPSLPPVEVAEHTAQVEALEAEVLAAIKMKEAR